MGSWSRFIGVMVLVSVGVISGRAAEPEARWWRGCLHAHSLGSDADTFPETAIDWYKRHGYHFFALTDHNWFQEGRRWLAQEDPQTPGPGGKRKIATPAAMKAYRELFGPEWVDECTSAGKRMVRLKTFEEIRGKFDEPERFLLIPGEEVTTGETHINVFNLSATIAPPKSMKGQPDARVRMARSIMDLVEAQRRATGRPLLSMLCHPGWVRTPMTVDEVARIDFIHIMEINNDDSGCSESLPVSEKLWDGVLAQRLERGLPPMLVTAGDDTHEYIEPNQAPDGGLGHGWIMVRAAELTWDSLLAAMKASDFYATSGVMLKDVRREGGKLALEIAPRDSDVYTTEFVGMRKGGEPGQVLATSTELKPVYEMKGDEIYVRAKVTSSRLRTTKNHEPVFEMAWTQPVRGE